MPGSSKDSSTRTSQNQTSTSVNLRGALQEEMGNFIRQSQVSEIRQKYHSLNSLHDSEKIQAVKDTSLNPFLFDDPYDGLANSMSRWAQEAPVFSGKDDATKTQIASKYYDETLAPLYQKMGAPPLSKDIWLRNAWKTGLSYDPSQAYSGGFFKGALHGEDSAIASTMNAVRSITNVAGLPIVAFEDSIKSGDLTGLTGFYNLFVNMHNRVKEDGLLTGVSETIEETGERNPTGGSKWMHDISSQQSFWRDVTPARTFTEKASSFVVENAMLLPLFGAIGKASELGIGLVGKAGEGVPIIKNLTETLGATKLGQTAAKMLTYGTEGLIFNDLTVDAKDEKDAWKTVLQFAAAGTLFSFAGKGVSKLVDMLPEGAEKASMSAAEREAELGMQGKRSATPDEYLEAHRREMASNIAAGGMSLQHSIYEEALARVVMTERAPITEAEHIAWAKAQIKNDPAHYKPVFSAVTMIHNYLKERGLMLKDLDPQSREFKGLIEFLHTQANQAAIEMDLHVPEVQQMKGQELLEDYMKTPAGKQEWEQELAKQQEAFKEHPGGAEKAKKVAEATMLKRRTEAVRKAAEDKLVTGPENVAKNQPIETASRRVESRYDYDKTGRVTGYQMGISFNWNVAADAAARAKGGKNSAKFWQEYVADIAGKNDDDVSVAHALADDLRTYFNPLKDYGLTFEKANTQGGDYTNFLAYMHSYRSKLPKAVANKLEEVLMNSPKMSKLLGSRPTTAKIDEFGQAIQNHVDIFTRSKWYKQYGQRNVFSSSQPGIHGENSLSKWQRDSRLIESAHKLDIAKGKEYYPGKSKAAIEARTRYESSLKLLHDQEMDAYLSGDAHKVAKLMARVRKVMASAEVQ